MTIKNKTRIAFDFDRDWRNSFEKLERIICSSHWASGIDISGSLHRDHPLLLDLIKTGTVVIDECEYELHAPTTDNENARHIESMLGKRSSHPVLRDMAALFADEPFERSEHYRNTLYLPNIKAFSRADGMKPEDIAEMLARNDCEKIILFPYFPLEEKPAYYELTLGVTKENFVHFMNRVEEQRLSEMHEAIMMADERSKASYRASLHPSSE
jgi:hypothetical protein